MLKDNFKLGLVLGILGPFVGMLAFYLWKFRVSVSLWGFIKVLAIENRLLTNMITFSLFANAVLFTLFINNDKDKTAKGIFVITCIWALGAIFLKWWY